MSIFEKSTRINKRAVFSALWIFLMLNTLFRDIHDLFRPGLLEEMISGTVNGVPVQEGVLFVAGILLEIPLMMIFLSQVLVHRVNRWANAGASLLTFLAMFTSTPKDMDDYWFFGVSVATLGFIIWYAWRWRED